MARPIKQGLDYFPLDVDFLQNIKVKKIKRGCGPNSISVLISLLGSIYKDAGYYVGWDNDISFLVADEVGTSEGAVNEIVAKALQVDFFNTNMFEQYQILTSTGIQKRFFAGTEKRLCVSIYELYWLLKDDQNYVRNNLQFVNSPENGVFDTGNRVNDPINSINDPINSINDPINSQSKVKESKVKESKVKNTPIEDIPKTAVLKSGDTKSKLKEVWGKYEFNLDLEVAIRSWLKYKQEKNQSYKPQGLNNLLVQLNKKANEYGESAVINLIGECMANNWSGIIWDKLKNRSDHHGGHNIGLPVGKNSKTEGVIEKKRYGTVI